MKELILINKLAYRDGKQRAYPSHQEPNVLAFCNAANFKNKDNGTLKTFIDELQEERETFFQSQLKAFKSAGMVLSPERVDEIVEYPAYMDRAFMLLEAVDGNVKGMYSQYIDVNLKEATAGLNEAKYDARYSETYKEYATTPTEIKRLKECKELIKLYTSIGVTRKCLPDNPFTKWDINGYELSPNLSYVKSGHKGDWFTHVSQYMA